MPAWTQKVRRVLFNQFLRANITKTRRPNWVHLSKLFNAQFPHKEKSPHQCRQRYINHSSLFSKEQKQIDWKSEDYQKLFQQFKTHGPKWAKIVKFFEGKTQNSIKNKFYSCLRKFLTKINKLLAKERRRTFKTIQSKSFLRIIKANQSFHRLPQQLRQRAKLIKQKMLDYSNPNIPQTSNQQMLSFMDELNQFNLKSRSYRFQKTKQEKEEFSRIFDQVKIQTISEME